MTHWKPIGAGPKSGVNARNFAPGDVAGITIRHFDGAVTWAFTD